MACMQCEQTAGGVGCLDSVGVCGKTAEVAAEQDLVVRTLLLAAIPVCPTDLCSALNCRSSSSRAWAPGPSLP